MTSLLEAGLGCLMYNLPEKDAVRVLKWAEENIPPAALVNGGLERCPHVTVAYGFQPYVTPAKVLATARQAVSVIGELTLKLGRVGRFKENPAQDVLHLEIESAGLTTLNKSLQAIFGQDLTQSFEVYRPHMTLAYVKPGALPGLDGHAKFLGDLYLVDQVEFSAPDSTAKATTSLAMESRRGVTCELCGDRVGGSHPYRCLRCV